MDIKTIIKHPLICLLSDDCTNLKQEMYCIDSEVIFILKKEKIFLIKEELKNIKKISSIRKRIIKLKIFG